MKRVHLLLAIAAIIASCQKQMEQKRVDESKTETTSQGIASALTIGNTNYVFNESALTSAGWTRVFNDDFTTADYSNWNIWTGGAFNSELQYYQAANLGITNSDYLNITAKKETVTGITTPYNTRTKRFNYTSARLESKVLYSSSATTPKVRMVARIKLPAGYGMWPAFWSYGDPWPTEGEIDILEARGQEPFKYQTNYFYGTTANNNLVSNATTVITSAVSLQSDFHVYELIWEQNALTFMLDGQVVDVKTGSYVPSLFGKKEKIVLNLAVGGKFFSGLIASKIVPGTMQVDWVKVFTSN